MNTRNAELEKDTAFWVTRKLYRCRIPYIQTLSPDYIAFFGVPDSGDERVNQQMRNELTEVHLPIGRMAEYFATGTQIYIPDPRVTKEIYERIVNHLKAWKHEIENRMHPGDVPADDLIKLDKFAAALFPHAKPFFEDEFIQSHFVRQMNSMLSINRNTLMRRAKKVAEDKDKPKKEQQHTGFTDVFLAQRRNKGGSRWN